ncbi:adhesion G-protein coupled receptor V1-like [Amphiura filiformis]|uniref:adhesion G-protein coupled receptor V1-like n=1 Tax=Amphiura filiformis TaxID=82378 RepID=UPI003B227C61
MDSASKISPLWVCLLLFAILSPDAVQAQCDTATLDTPLPALTLGAKDGTRVMINVQATASPVIIQLKPTPTATDAYEIVLGTDNTRTDGTYSGGSGIHAAIARVDGTGNPVAGIDTGEVVSSNVVTSIANKDFFIRVESNGDGSLSVGVSNGLNIQDFITLTDTNTPLGVNNIVFTAGTGTFQVCDPNTLSTSAFEINPDDLVIDTPGSLNDGDINTCETSGGGGPSGFVVYLDAEYEVLGVRIQHDETTTNLATSQVTVGNCGYVGESERLDAATANDINMAAGNVDCGDPITGPEEGAGGSPVYRMCPINTYGNVLYIYRTGAAAIKICDIRIYAIKRPDAEKTTVSFQSATEIDTEEDGVTVLPKKITLTRTGGTGTCAIARVYRISGDLTLDSDGTCSAGDDILYDMYTATEDLTTAVKSAIVVFDKDAAETTLDLTICGDYACEDDKFAVFGFDEQDHTACTGATPTTTLTINDDDPDYYFEQAKYYVDEVKDMATTDVTLTVIRGCNLQEDTMITFVTSDGAPPVVPPLQAAMGPSDYIGQVLGDKTVTFSNQDTSETVTVTINDDDLGEGPENFQITLHSVIAGVSTVSAFSSTTRAGGETATICINDNEPGFQFVSSTDPLWPAPYMGLETNGEIEVTVQNIGSSAIGGTVRLTASVEAGNTATEGSDFLAFTTDVVFEPGDTSKVVAVPIINDATGESAETFTLTLTSATGDTTHIVTSGSKNVAILTINDDDATVSMAVSTQDVTETDGNVVITIMRDATYLTRAAWVDLQISPVTASSPGDYIEPDVVRVYFSEGEDSTSIVIPIVDDREVEENETFTVTIVGADNPIHATDRVTTVNIQSDDALIWIVQTPTQVIEGGIFNATVMREGGDGFDHSVHLNTNSDDAEGATAGVDFEVLSMLVTFGDNEYSKVIPIQTYEDTKIEDLESFRVSISEPNEVIDLTRDSIIVDILDDDSLIGFDQILYEVTETTGSDTDVQVSLTRGGDLSNPVTVYLSTVEINGAQAGSDFSPLVNMPVTFQANADTVSQDITIEADGTPEFDEIFQVIVRSDTSGGLNDIDPNRSAANISVSDDDSGSFRFDDTAYSVDEGVGIFNARILRPGATAGYVTLLVTISPAKATYPEDYRQEEVLVEFAPGQDEATVSIGIVADDDIQEGDETFVMSLTVQSQFGTVDPDFDEATVTILDSRSVFSLSTNSPTVVESEPGYVEVTIRRSGSTNTDTFVSLRTVDGTATHSGDFQGFNIKTFSFPSGTAELTFRIPIDDNDFEEDEEETFSVYVLSGDGQVIQDSRLIITIIDDDGYFFFVPTSNEDREDGIVTYRTSEDSGTVLIKVQRTGNANGYGSVRATTTDDSAEADGDYQPLNLRVISFQPAATTAEFTVDIVNDDNPENDESFFIELSLAQNGVVIEPRKALVIIESNDGRIRRPGSLSRAAIIGIAVGVGSLVIIGFIAVIACCLLFARRVPVPRKPPALRGPGAGPGPIPQYGVPMDFTGIGPYPYQTQVPGYYPY